MDSFFRKQAIEHQKDRLHGDLLVLPRLSHTLILSALLLWVVLVCIWLFTSNYARKETVSGWLEPASGVTRIYPQGNGVIKQVFVEEGDVVVKDQPLMVVNGDQLLADGSALEEQLLDEYQHQKESLEEQIERSRSLYDQRKADTRQAPKSAQLELELINEQAITLNQRLLMATKRERRYHSLLTNKHISDEEYNDVKAGLLAVQSELQALARDRLRQTGEVTRLESELNQLPFRRRRQQAQGSMIMSEKS